jgi:hypothetical protein
MSQHQVLTVKRYSFSDENNKEVKGCKVTFVDEPETSEDFKGIPIMTVNVPYDMWNQFPKVPANYELEFRMRPDAKGKPSLSLFGAALVG